MGCAGPSLRNSGGCSMVSRRAWWSRGQGRQDTGAVDGPRTRRPSGRPGPFSVLAVVAVVALAGLAPGCGSSGPAGSSASEGGDLGSGALPGVGEPPADGLEGDEQAASCAAVLCLTGTRCEDGRCIPLDDAPGQAAGAPCASEADCPDWAMCHEGTCHDRCIVMRCTAGTRCHEGQCRPLDPQQACEQAGATWREFPNTCGDICVTEPPMCGQAFMPGCDCGPGRCWTGMACVDGRGAADW